jgi:sugar phosphate isomerase/epimerase
MPVFPHSGIYHQGSALFEASRSNGMYRNLNSQALGLSGRQSEILEIALTYRFRGIDVDIQDLAKRMRLSSVEHACRYLSSAKLKIGGFEAPVRWTGSDADFKADITNLPEVLQVAKALNADRAYVLVKPVSETLPMHENFQFHADRLTELSEALKNHKIRLAIGFLSAPSHRAEGAHQFIHQAEPMLQLLSSVRSENAGLLLDLWDWHVGGGTLEHLRNLKKGQVVIVRVADVPADADLTTITDEQRLLPGDGAVDVASYLALLDQQFGYDGPVTPFPHTSQFRGMTREAIVQRATTLLDALWNSAGLNKAAPPKPPAPPAQAV